MPSLSEMAPECAGCCGFKWEGGMHGACPVWAGCCRWGLMWLGGVRLVARSGERSGVVGMRMSGWGEWLWVPAVEWLQVPAMERLFFARRGGCLWSSRETSGLRGIGQTGSALRGSPNTSRPPLHAVELSVGLVAKGRRMGQMGAIAPYGCSRAT